MKNKYVFFTALTLFLSGSVYAGNTSGYGINSGYVAHYGSGYIGLGFGRTDNNAGINQLTSPTICHVVGSNCSADDRDKAWHIQGGYRFSPNFALEGAYIDLGNTADITDGSLRGHQDTKGISLSAVGKVPLGGAASLYGKAGVFRWDSDARVGNNNTRAHGTEPVIGLGLEYQMTNQWTTRLGWDRYFNVGDNNAFLDASGANVLETDVDVYSIGLYYHF